MSVPRRGTARYASKNRARRAIAITTFAEGDRMRTLLAVLAVGAVLSFGSGCKDQNHDMDHDSTHTQKMSSDDVCTHCAGVQHATADGKCPECGMKVNKM
jgi:uncharacterized paraquat-inducible protein A